MRLHHLEVSLLAYKTFNMRSSERRWDTLAALSFALGVRTTSAVMTHDPLSLSLIVALFMSQVGIHSGTKISIGSDCSPEPDEL